MAEMMKDMKIEESGKIIDKLKENEKIDFKGAVEKDYNEIIGLDKILKLIKNDKIEKTEKIEKIKKHDVCELVMDLIARDCVDFVAEDVFEKPERQEQLKQLKQLQNQFDQDCMNPEKDKKIIEEIKAALEELKPGNMNIQLRRMDFLSAYIDFKNTDNIIVKRAIAKDWATRKTGSREGGFSFDSDASLISSYFFAKLLIFQKRENGT